MKYCIFLSKLAVLLGLLSSTAFGQWNTLGGITYTTDIVELRDNATNDTEEELSLGFSDHPTFGEYFYFSTYDHGQQKLLPLWFSISNLSIGAAPDQTGTYMLQVNGKIRATEIKVETGWADFVFDEDYDLPSLQEVKRHIKENKHLPGIPSEENVAAEGVNLGEMQSKLLQKVEELTLYMIDLKKENDALKARVLELEK